MSFVHLHVHTEYSLLDGACRLNKMFPIIADMGQNACAMTDHGNMYATILFYKAAKKAGIKPIIGCEVYTTGYEYYNIKDSRLLKEGREFGHLILLCKDNNGYKNLIELVSKANIEGFHYKPRVDIELLEKYHEGLICLSACIAGDVPRLILKGDYDGAKALALRYRDIFGEDNYYLEIQDHGIPEQKVSNEALIRMSKETGIPLVATNDAHYMKKSDAMAQKVLMCVQMKKTLEDDTGMFPTDEFYLKSEDEMRELFEFVPEAIENTQKIADRCDVSFPEIDDAKNRVYFLPVFKWTEGLSHYDYLRKITYEGFDQRYTKEQQTDELKKRVEYELSVINSMGFVDYFLIVMDFIRYSKNNGIPIGPGRGSGAGSIVAYCCRITNIEPIQYNLIFERFLNPERISMPDFDVDMCPVRRHEVFEYVQRKYGHDNVTNIVTFGTMKAKNAIRDCGRVLSVPLPDVDKVAKLIPDKKKIHECVEIVPEIKQWYETDPKIKTLIDTAEVLEDMPRNASVHACGIVIGENPIYKYVPVAVNQDVAVAQFDKAIVEDVGLVKMDFLGLRNLTVIEDASKLIRRREPDFNIEKINMEDQDVYEMLSQGKTEGVFQLESGGMKQTLIGLKPRKLEDLIAIISLYRPGPMDSIPTYIDNKNHPDSIKYKDPHLEHILNVTYGVMVYQEQVMQIVRDLAGYSFGRADIVRKAMGKKKMDVMMREREYFINGKKKDDGSVEIPGCVANGIPAEVANDIFDEMVKFAEYAFNKSHAAAYAYVTFYTAYLRCHYPTEYMAALITSVIDKTNKLVSYINDCTKQGVKVLPPDINESEDIFSVSDGCIRFGLSAIKAVSNQAIMDIIKERTENGPFKDFYDFCKRTMADNTVDSRTVENLIHCGAFDCFGVNRRALKCAFPEIKTSLTQYFKEKETGQMSLFEDEETGEEEEFEYQYPKIDEYPKKEKLALEKEVTGLYLSDHPCKEYQAEFEQSGAVSIISISDEDSEYKNNDRIRVFGILTKVTKKMTKNETQMALCTLQDLTGSIEILAFGKAYEKVNMKLAEDKIVIVDGKVSIKEDMSRSSDDDDEEDNGSAKMQASIIINDVTEVQTRADIHQQPKAENFDGKVLVIRFRDDDAPNLNRCAEILMKNEGKVPVYFNFVDKKKQARFNKACVMPSRELYNELEAVLGANAVSLKST